MTETLHIVVILLHTVVILLHTVVILLPGTYCRHCDAHYCCRYWLRQLMSSADVCQQDVYELRRHIHREAAVELSASHSIQDPAVTRQARHAKQSHCKSPSFAAQTKGGPCTESNSTAAQQTGWSPPKGVLISDLSSQKLSMLFFPKFAWLSVHWSLDRVYSLPNKLLGNATSDKQHTGWSAAQQKVYKQLHLHATDLEAQSCLSGAGILGFALVNVPLVCGWVPGTEAQLDVYYAWVPISFGHIFQL